MGKKKQNIFNKYNKLIFSLLFSIVLSGIILTVNHFGLFNFFENRILDFRFKYFNQNKAPSKEVIFIDVDDNSLQELSDQFGSWPWPRGLILKLIVEYIMIGQPAAFLFDIVYAEKSPKTPDIDLPEEDNVMQEESALFPNVSHAVLFKDSDTGKSALPPEMKDSFLIQVNDTKSTIRFKKYNDVLIPYDPLYKNANSLHSVTVEPDIDGVSRKGSMLVHFKNKYYPSLALKGLMFKLGIKDIKIEDTTLIFKDKNNQVNRIQLDKDGNLPLNFYKNSNAFITIPATAIIASNGMLEKGEQDLLVDFNEFKDKIVIFGASALGLKDIKLSPTGEEMAGPYLHLTAVSNILDKDFLINPPRYISITLILFSIILILSTTTFLKNRYAKNILGLGFIFLQATVAMILFKMYGIVVELASTLTASLLGYFGALIYLSLTEEAEKRKVSNALSKYLAPAVMTEVLENYQELIGEVGEKKELTILFSDIRSFTTISENFPAETVVSILNKYLGRMINIIFDHRGTVDKFIGDAIMAFWGAPNNEPEKDYLAVVTGIKMIRELKDFNESIQKEGNVPNINIGVGINTGDMIVGNIGSEKRLDYTVIGDNVNLGSRIEGLTKYYKLPLLVTGSTYQNTKDRILYLFVDTVAVKGKEEGIKIYTPLHFKEENQDDTAAKQEIITFNAAHKLYLAQNFKEAAKAFKAAAASLVYLKGLAGVFKERCDHFNRKPPENDWNGVWVMHDK